MKCSFKKYRISLMVLIAIALQPSNSMAQDSLKSTIHSVSLITQFYQIKDAANYGLVFNGPNIAGRYALKNTTEKRSIIYNPEFSFGANFNKGIGLAWGVSPVDIYMGRNISRSKPGTFGVGAYVLTNYNWQLYPELQSGHMFWFTSIEIGPQMIFAFPIKQRKLNITFSNSLAGFISRPKPATESYFYSLTFSDFITNAHSNLELGSYNLFSHTNVEIEVLPNTNRRLSVAYEFEYFGYYTEPKLSQLAHSLHLNWKIGKI